MNMPSYKTTRIWSETLMKLRRIAVLRETSIVRALDLMADEELKRLKREGKELR